MKHLTRTMLAVIIMGAGFCYSATAQLTSIPSGGNKKATAGERIGITDVTIHYDRPHVKGRDGKRSGAPLSPWALCRPRALATKQSGPLARPAL